MLRQLSQRSLLAAYKELSGESHMTLPLRTDMLFRPLLAWMQAIPAAMQSCSEFALPSQMAAGATLDGSARASTKP